jgi:2-hydroxychromene-2-carboxylate isomerase
MAGSSTANSPPGPKSPTGPNPGQPVFYYDLGSPQCYIVAETIMATLPVVPEWEPVLASDIPAVDPEHLDRERIEQLTQRLGLQPIRWPKTWPPNTESAMLAATYAKRIGRAVAFSLAAFRQTFAGGRDLADDNTVFIAGAACEMHPTALRRGIDLASTKTALQAATERARRAGATALPAIQVGNQLFIGTDAITPAASALEKSRT